MSLLCLKGGCVYDPTHGVDGEVRDVWIEDARVIPEPVGSERRPDRVIDVTGCVVMPAAIDLHSHIVGPGVDAARKMVFPSSHDVRSGKLQSFADEQSQQVSEEEADRERALRSILGWCSEPCVERVRQVLAATSRMPSFAEDPLSMRAASDSGMLGCVPPNFLTGYLYAALGYGTVFDAAVAPEQALIAARQLQATPLIDKGFFALVGNHRVILEVLQQEPQRLPDVLAWLLHVTAAYAPKVVNPGGVEHWRRTRRPLTELDQTVSGWSITPRQIVTRLAEAANQLGLPHPLHVHCNNLGRPGNWRTTLQTFQALNGLFAHFAHVQFHSYGGEPDKPGSLRSQVPELIDYFNSHPHLTVDVGAVLFGPTVTVTNDLPLSEMLAKLTGGQWWSTDTQPDLGCGIVPLNYSHRSLVNCVQWAVGLEWLLLAEDLWRITLTTDHPNGAPFLAYPRLIAYLMDSDRRREVFSQLPPQVRQRCVLHEIEREYSLYEVAIVTRAAPARILGLPQKGHLGPGADADVTVYHRSDDVEQMFLWPRLVILAGEVVVEDGQLRHSSFGQLLRVAPPFDARVQHLVYSLLAKHSKTQPPSYGVPLEELGPTRITPLRK